MIEKNKLITAMVTPFNINGDVDYKASKKLAKALSETGSDGILIGGTTGESPTCLLYTSPSPRDRQKYRMPSSA